MIGQMISHYRILEKLGEGGMGVVYKAHDTQLDRLVALKFLPHYLTSDPAEKERFYHEARSAGALTHQNIAVVHEIGEHEHQLFIVMEYVEGKTLKQLIATESLSIKKNLDFAIQICEGLAAAHEKGVVHRDIKPDNIIVTPKGQAKIMDFGLAKIKGATKLTKAGSTLGTAVYMSPEQAQGEDVDHRTDIFSLGVMLYEMLAGKPPFRGEHTAAILYSIANDEPPPLARFNEKVTEELQHIVLKALEKDKEDRYQHVDEMLSDLRRERKHLEYARTGYATTTRKLVSEVTTGKEEAPVPETVGRRAAGKRRTKVVAVFGIVMLLIAGFLLLRPFFQEGAISSERRTIAVISFVNQTGDNAYDYLQDAIPNLLITNLEQSKYLQVATWERLYDLRKQIGKADTKFIDRDLGFELCKMDNIDAIVLGSFTKAGDVFATDVKVLDVQTKQLLKSTNSKGDGVGSILRTQIDELSREIARGVGLSEGKIATTPMQIKEYTTSSMDAYNYFLRGVEDYQKFYHKEALKFLEKAVSIDSAFASAYVYLAFTYERLNDHQASMAAYQKAASYSQRAPERDHLMVEAALATNVEHNREKAFNLLKEVTDKYPKDKWGHFYIGIGYSRRKMTSEAIKEYTLALQLDPKFGAALNQLGYVYAEAGEFEKAVECFRKYAEVNPGDPNPFDSMGELYFKMGRLDDAVAKYKEVLELSPGFARTNMCLAYIYLLQEDFDKALRCMNQFIADAISPGLKAEGCWYRAMIDYYALGKLRQALSDLDQAHATFHSIGDERRVALIEELRGYIHYDRHDTVASRKSFGKVFEQEAAFDPNSGIRAEGVFILGWLALANAKVTDAQVKVAEMDSLMPLFPLAKGALRNHRDQLYAEVLILKDSADAAISLLEKSGLPEIPNFSSEPFMRYNAPFARDVIARAYIKKGNSDKAITEYEKIVTFDPKSIDRRMILPKYHYLLAKLYEKNGLLQEAAKHYERFLALWKDADPDLSEVKDAKSRLKALR